MAIAVINGKSPQLVLAVVEKINKVNSSGETLLKNESFLLEEPIRHVRECPTSIRLKSSYYYNWDSAHTCDVSCTEYWQTTEVRAVPYCSVKATPRGFSRSTDKDGKVRSVTYSIPENIILIESRDGVAV